MPEIPALIVVIVITALIFDFINGFHDSANAIATVVSTRVLSPRNAILMAGILNFVGALVSTTVAKTVAGGLVGTNQFASSEVRSVPMFLQTLQSSQDPVTTYLRSHFSLKGRELLATYKPGYLITRQQMDILLNELNAELEDPMLYSPQRFEGIKLSRDTRKMIAGVIPQSKLPEVNRALLEAAYPGYLEPSHAITQSLILAAIIGAIAWDLITWRFGIPSSSSHALIGGLIGAAIARGGFDLVMWKGLWDKVILPLICSPIAGFIIGFILMLTIFALFSHVHPGKVSSIFRRMQMLSAAAMAFSHGQNDAQKSMGIITLSLVAIGVLKHPNVPIWVIIICATSMGLGTAAGGWRIINTMGHKIIRLEPVHGFAAETSAAFVIFFASHFGMPVSTTHVISGSIFGVGSSKRLSAVRWGVAGDMIIAWVLTIPASAIMSGLVYVIFNLIGMK